MTYAPLADWLDALQVVQHAGLKRAVMPLYSSVIFGDELADLLPAAAITQKGEAIHVKLHQQIASLPRVERIEIMCWIAATSWRLLNIIDFSRDEQAALCIQLGCACSPHSSIEARWRRIGFELDPRRKDVSFKQQSLVSRLFEDRPKCGWCEMALITGTVSPVRADLHTGCYNYIQQVARPQMQAARAAEQAAYAAAKEHPTP